MTKLHTCIKGCPIYNPTEDPPPASSCSPGPAGSVSDPATLESIRSALNYLVYGVGRKRCPQNVYADAHYGLAMVEKAQRESPNDRSQTR